jgi:hypothetical protein
MNTIRAPLLLAVALLAALAAGACRAAEPPQACDITAHVIDPDIASPDPRKGVNVRATPGGKVIAALKYPKGHFNGAVSVHIAAQEGDWFLIDRVWPPDDWNAVMFEQRGYLHRSVLGAGQRLGGGLRAAPDIQSQLVEPAETATPDAPQERLALLGCAKDWARVGRPSGAFTGWVKDDTRAHIPVNAAGDQVMKLLDAADQGQANAQYLVGRMNEAGQFMSRNDAQAAIWYRKAADQGEAGAQYRLGLLYEQGRGLVKDAAKAILWYEKSAGQGNADAQLALGALYFDGHGVAQSDAQALAWFRKAAEQGLAGAQYNLAVMLANGNGISRNKAEAIAWLQKAAAQGYAGAKDYLDRLSAP